MIFLSNSSPCHDFFYQVFEPPEIEHFFILVTNEVRFDAALIIRSLLIKFLDNPDNLTAESNLPSNMNDNVNGCIRRNGL